MMPLDLPPDVAHYAHYAVKSYPRYGGMVQLSPLSADEQKYDDTCREIDRLEGEIGSKSMLLFTASEFIWFNAFVSKMHFFPKQPQLDRQLEDLRGLLKTLESRAPQ